MDMQGANPAALSVETMERIRPYQFLVASSTTPKYPPNTQTVHEVFELASFTEKRESHWISVGRFYIKVYEEHTYPCEDMS